MPSAQITVHDRTEQMLRSLYITFDANDNGDLEFPEVTPLDVCMCVHVWVRMYAYICVRVFTRTYVR
jgi:hypothetical protein